MKKIKLFIDPVLYYMEDSSVFAGSHYIDLFEGEVISPDVDDISHEDVKNEDRYFYIEPITSHEGYEIMQDFAALEESDEILIKNKACNICTHDYQQWQGFRSHQPFPNAWGHENAGIVMEVGDRVKNIKVGDHVVENVYIPCLKSSN